MTMGLFGTRNAAWAKPPVDQGPAPVAARSDARQEALGTRLAACRRGSNMFMWGFGTILGSTIHVCLRPVCARLF